MFDVGDDAETETAEVSKDATGSDSVTTSVPPSGTEKTLSSYFSSGASSDDPFASLSQSSQIKSEVTEEAEEEEFLSLPPATTVTALPEYEAAAAAESKAVKEEEDTRNEETIITAEIGGKAHRNGKISFILPFYCYHSITCDFNVFYMYNIL